MKIIALLIFIFSNSVFLQNQKNPEQIEYNFPGFTLKGCLGSELSKPKRQVAKLPSKQAQRYLKELFPFLQGENEDFVKAKNVLNKMQSDNSLTESDKAQIKGVSNKAANTAIFIGGAILAAEVLGKVLSN